MKDEKFSEICEIYKERVLPFQITEPCNYGETYKHILWMLWRIPFFVKEGRRRKANRWLGFVQGFLWANGIYTIEEMKEHNRPNE